MSTSEAIILDLVNCPEQSHAIITQLKHAAAEAEANDGFAAPMDQLLIGVSTVLTWGRTSSKPGGKTPVFNETQYKRRKCSPRFRGVRQLETLVLAAQRESLFSYVVAPGVLYGNGESAFHLLFRDAWLCNKANKAGANAVANPENGNANGKTGSGLMILGEGNNVIPTIHVSDLAEAVLQLLYSPPTHTQYVVAVDGSRATQRQIVRAIAHHLGLGAGAAVTVSKDDPRLVQALLELDPASAAAADSNNSNNADGNNDDGAGGAAGDADGTNAAAAAATGAAPLVAPSDTATAGVGSGDPEVLLLNLAFQTQSCTLAQLPLQWRCLDGLPAALPAVHKEFLAARKLRPVRVHIAGGPGSGKSLYATRIANGLRLPHVTVAQCLEDAAASKTQLGDAIRRFFAEAGAQSAAAAGGRFGAGSASVSAAAAAAAAKRGSAVGGGAAGSGNSAVAAGVAGGARKPGAPLSVSAVAAAAGVGAGTAGAGKAGKPGVLGGRAGAGAAGAAAGSAEDTYLGLRLPAKLVCEAVRRRLRSPECRNKGFVLDGFPRTAEEAKLLWRQRARVFAESEDGDDGGGVDPHGDDGQGGASAFAGEDAGEGAGVTLDAEGNVVEREDITWLQDDDEDDDGDEEGENGHPDGGDEEEDDDDEETIERLRMLEILQAEIEAEEEEAAFADNSTGAGADGDDSGAPKPVAARASGAARLRRLGGPLLRRSRRLDPATRVDLCIFLHVTEAEAARRLRELPQRDVIERHNDQEGFRRRWARWTLQQGALGVASTLAARALNNNGSVAGGAAAQQGGAQQQGSIYDWVDVDVLEVGQDVAADVSRALGVIQAYVTRLGKPFNYFPAPEDVAAARAERDAAARAAAQRAQAARIAKARAEAAERARREAHDAQMRQTVLEQDRKLVEACSLPLRQYLVTHVVPAVVDGLLDVCKTQPQDPVDHLAEYLFKIAVNGSTFTVDDQA